MNFWVTYAITIRSSITRSAARMIGLFRRRRFLCRLGRSIPQNRKRVSSHAVSSRDGIESNHDEFWRRCSQSIRPALASRVLEAGGLVLMLPNGEAPQGSKLKGWRCMRRGQLCDWVVFDPCVCFSDATTSDLNHSSPFFSSEIFLT